MAGEGTAKRGVRTARKAAVNEDMTYVLIRMRNGDLLRHCHGARHRDWWSIGDGMAARTVDDRTAQALKRRGLIAGTPYRAGSFEVVHVLTGPGREEAARLPAEPDPACRTPGERRSEAFMRRAAAASAARTREQERRLALRGAERAVLEAVDAYFGQRGSFDAVEAAHLKLEALKGG